MRKMAPFVIVFLPCLLGLWSQVSNGLDLKSNRRSRFGMNTLPDNNKIKVSVAVVMPHSMFKQREYKKIIMQSALELDGSVFEDTFDLSPYLEMVQAIPSPTEVLGKICDQVCKGQVCIISKIYRFAKKVTKKAFVKESLYKVNRTHSTVGDFILPKRYFVK